LEKGRITGDLIQVFRIVRSLDIVEFDELFELDDGGGHVLRGHSWKLKVKRCRLQVRKCFLTQRIINVWNKLPSSCSRKDSMIGAWMWNYKLCLHPLPVTSYK